MENDLLIIRSFKLKSIVSKFRLSSHKLVIEKGRHVKSKLPPDHRICMMGNINAVDDELHLLIKCPCYSKERKWFLKMCNMEYTDLEDKKCLSIFYEC